jgi:hypothetical protein
MRRYEVRWWDGSRWTHRVANHGHVMSDPVMGEPGQVSGQGTVAMA